MLSDIHEDVDKSLTERVAPQRYGLESDSEKGIVSALCF